MQQKTLRLMLASMLAKSNWKIQQNGSWFRIESLQNDRWNSWFLWETRGPSPWVISLKLWELR